MIIEISIAIAVLIFAILAFFIIRTLITLRITLKQVEELTFEARLKIQDLDSSFNALANLGDMCESETERMREKYLEKSVCHTSDTSDDLIDWLRASIKLGGKYLTRR
jgi:hypothetical protein